MGIQFVSPNEVGAGIFVGATPDWQLKQQQVDQANTFSNGVPTDASGNIDYAAAAKSLMSKGAYDPAFKMIDAGITQGQVSDASKLAAGMSKWLSPTGSQPSTPANPAPSSATPTATTGGYFPVFQNAIAGIESGGNYGALGPKTDSGDRAFGKYQVMASNIGPWSKEILGTALTPEQFLANPQAQDAIFNGKFHQYLKQTGNPQDAASMWFTGKPYAQGAGRTDQLGTSGSDYVSKFMTALRNGPTSQPTRGGAPAPAGSDPSPIPTAPARTRTPMQVADADAPALSGTHPFGPTSAPPSSPASPPTVPNQAPVSSQAAPPPPPMQSGPISAGPASVQPVGSMSQMPKPAPIPQTLSAPPPISPNAATLTHPNDPTFGGQVPQAWLAAGYAPGQYVNFARANAGIASMNPRAQGVAAQWGKIADGLQTSIEKYNELTPEQKNSRDPVVQTAEMQRDAAKAQSRVNAQNSPIAIQGAGARSEATEEGKTFGQVPGQLASAADSARNQNQMVDAMLDAGQQFDMGKYADKEQAFNATVSALGHKLNVDTSSIDGKVASYQDFAKLAGQFSRQAMKETGGRAGGVQELQFITNTLPSPTMSPDGFRAVANQLKGLGDFQIAKQQAGQAWLSQHGTMSGFDSNWNQNVSPAAFVMHRLQVDQPQQFSATVQRLAQSAQGRASLRNMRSGMSWAGSGGLFPDQGGQ